MTLSPSQVADVLEIVAQGFDMLGSSQVARFLREAARSAAAVEIADDPQDEPTPCGCPVGKCYVHSECSRAECFGVPEVAHIACKKTIFPAAPAPAATTAHRKCCKNGLPVPPRVNRHCRYPACDCPLVPETPGPAQPGREPERPLDAALHAQQAKRAADVGIPFPPTPPDAAQGKAIYPCKHCGAHSADTHGPDCPPTPAAPPAQADKCPTCDSPRPHLHPAMQHEGEVQECRDPWHKPPAVPESGLRECPPKCVHGVLKIVYCDRCAEQISMPSLTAVGDDRPLPIVDWSAAALTKENAALILGQQDGRCFYCAKPFERLDPSRVDTWDGYRTVIFDHLIPRSRGGQHGPENRVAACGHCDGRKGARLPTLEEMHKKGEQFLTRAPSSAQGVTTVGEADMTFPNLRLSLLRLCGASPGDDPGHSVMAFVYANKSPEEHRFRLGMLGEFMYEQIRALARLQSTGGAGK